MRRATRIAICVAASSLLVACGTGVEDSAIPAPESILHRSGLQAVQSFTYTGSTQTWPISGTIPPNVVSVRASVIGQNGSNPGWTTDGSPGGAGGLGGRVDATITLPVRAANLVVGVGGAKLMPGGVGGLSAVFDQPVDQPAGNGGALSFVGTDPSWSMKSALVTAGGGGGGGGGGQGTNHDSENAGGAGGAVGGTQGGSNGLDGFAGIGPGGHARTNNQPGQPPRYGINGERYTDHGGGGGGGGNGCTFGAGGDSGKFDPVTQDHPGAGGGAGGGGGWSCVNISSGDFPVSNVSYPTNTTQVASVTITAVDITTSQLPSATVGSPYSAQLAASNGEGPYSWSLARQSAPLPAGLSINQNGLISGTPTQASQAATFEVSVSDANGVTTLGQLTIAFSSQSAPPAPSPTTEPNNPPSTSAESGWTVGERRSLRSLLEAQHTSVSKDTEIIAFVNKSKRVCREHHRFLVAREIGMCHGIVTTQTHGNTHEVTLHARVG